MMPSSLLEREIERLQQAIATCLTLLSLPTFRIPLESRRFFTLTLSSDLVSLEMLLQTSSLEAVPYIRPQSK
jgi:hypothetical protein